MNISCFYSVLTTAPEVDSYHPNLPSEAIEFRNTWQDHTQDILESGLEPLYFYIIQAGLLYASISETSYANTVSGSQKF